MVTRALYHLQLPLTSAQLKEVWFEVQFLFIFFTFISARPGKNLCLLRLEGLGVNQKITIGVVRPQLGKGA